MTPTPIIPDRHRDALIDEISLAINRRGPYAPPYKADRQERIADAIRNWERQTAALENRP